MKILMIYWAAVNMLTFVIYGIDKWKAVHNAWRISEKTLILLAALGGAAGAYAAMQTFRHKTKHKKFTAGVPVMLAVQIMLLAAVIYRQ